MMLSEAIEDYKKEFENLSYEELRELGNYIVQLKKQKYSKSDTRKKQIANYKKSEIGAKKTREYEKRYAERNREKRREYLRKYQREYLNKNREKINAQKRKLYRKKKKNEKVIALSSEMATKHTNTSCVFDVSQLWTTYEHDYS